MIRCRPILNMEIELSSNATNTEVEEYTYDLPAIIQAFASTCPDIIMVIVKHLPKETELFVRIWLEPDNMIHAYFFENYVLYAIRANCLPYARVICLEMLAYTYENTTQKMRIVYRGKGHPKKLPHALRYLHTCEKFPGNAEMRKMLESSMEVAGDCAMQALHNRVVDYWNAISYYQ